jgi:hypothetical protein
MTLSKCCHGVFYVVHSLVKSSEMVVFWWGGEFGMKAMYEGCMVYIIKVNYYMQALLVCHLFLLIVSAKGFKL